MSRDSKGSIPDTLEGVLEAMSEIITNYHHGAYMSHSTLLMCQRNLAVMMYYLGEWKVYYHKEYVELYHEMREDKRSHASIERECELKIPELYLCRQILDRATTVSIAMQNDLKHIEKH